jgi:hypothetical protein
MMAWLGAIAGVLAVASAAAEEVVWQGELAFSVQGLPVLPAATGAGVSTVNGSLHLETARVDRGITGSSVVPITDPLITAGGLISVRGTLALGSGTIRFDPSASFGQPRLSAGILPVTGAMRLCLLYAGCASAYVPIDLTASSGSVGVGVGGLVTGGHLGPVRVSVFGAPWTVATASVSGRTPGGQTVELLGFGWVHGPLSFSSSTLLVTTSGLGGALQLVTPIRVETLGLGVGVPAGFATLRLRFVPEPSALLLVASGGAALVVLALRRGGRPQDPHPE